MQIESSRAYVATVKQHGETYEYWGATYDQALTRARAKTLGPLWEAILVFKIPEEK